MRDQRCDVRQFSLLGAQKLLARRNVEEKIAHRDDRARDSPRSRRTAESCRPRSSTRVPVVSSADRVSSSSRETDPMEGSASPRKPSVADLDSRSLTSCSLLVACRSKASRASSRSMPQPLSEMRMSRRPPFSTSMRTSVDAGVERIFQQFLDDRRGPFDHFTRRDLVGDLIGKNANAAHMIRNQYSRGGSMGRDENQVGGRAILPAAGFQPASGRLEGRLRPRLAALQSQSLAWVFVRTRSSRTRA